VILGIDPGRDKCGWVFATEEGELLASGIFPAERAEDFFRAVASGDGRELSPFVIETTYAFPEHFSAGECLVGNGTGKEFLLSLAKSVSLGVKLIPEKGTTLLARTLYWKHHPPRGMLKILPEGLRVPPRDVDDFAALAIVRRFIESRSAQ
jgi:RNase H-fold protein (predicted Holliday junction resolvase)